MEFGLNTKQQIFNPEIEKIASSIKKEFKIEVNRIEFITEFCNLLEEYLNKKLKYVNLYEKYKTIQNIYQKVKEITEIDIAEITFSRKRRDFKSN